MEKNKTIKIICDFITSTGIKLIEKDIRRNSFLPGVTIERGNLVFTPSQLLHPGDLLHEAGHIALTAAAERGSLNDNVMQNNPENEGYELGVMLWSYAACIKLHLPAEVVFHKDGYKGESEWILSNYRNKSYIGLPLLEWMGMTSGAAFPVMDKWLRD